MTRQQLAHALAEADLDELQRELSRVLGLRSSDSAVQVVIRRNQIEHRLAVSRLRVETPYRRALYVRDRGEAWVLAYEHRELALDLRHEGTHALLHADLPMIPLWLDEGIASYYQEPAGRRTHGGMHHARLVDDLRRGRSVPLAELEGRSELADLSPRDYRFAWGWVHFMLHGPRPATEVLWKFLADVRRRQPPEAFSVALARAVARPEAALRRHFQLLGDSAADLAGRRRGSR